MKYKLIALLAALLCTGAITPSPSSAASVVIHIGDRPYYRHGPSYWRRGVRYYWVPGHWRWRHGYRIWVHGHYAPRHW